MAAAGGGGDYASASSSSSLHDDDSSHSDSRDSGSSGSGESFEVTLDAHGRIAGAFTSKLNFNTRVLFFAPKNASSLKPYLSALVSDASKTFVQESFWLPANLKPRCALEAIAKEIYTVHTKDARDDIDTAASGAEWWVQLRTVGEKKETISFHFDKDEELVDTHGINVHPHISTVTYLTSRGAPTTILETTAGFSYEDDISASTVTRGTLSTPVAGKHLAFDGRYLHGAPSNLTPDEDECELRCTLLVNIWLNFKPTGIDLFPQEEIDALAAPSAVADLHLHDNGDVARRLTLGRQGGGRHSYHVHEYPFGPTGVEHLLRVPLPSLESKQHHASQGWTTLDLRFARECVASVQPNKPQASGKRRRTQ